MKPICFSLLGHNTVVVSDFIKYCYAEALSEGLEFYVSNILQPNAVCIVLDGLPDDIYSKFIHNGSVYKNINTSILFIQTEIVRDNILNSGATQMKTDPSEINNLYESQEYWSSRFLKFNKMLPLVDHVACMHYLSHEYLDQIGYEEASLINMRYHEAYSHKSHQFNFSRQTIDFIFTGTLTNHRQKLLERLQNEGKFDVVSMLPLTGDDWRLSITKNSKVYLGIKHDQSTPQASVMRIYWALMNEVFAVHEYAIEPNELDPYYLTFNNYDDLLNIQKLKMMERKEIALDLKSDFRNQAAPELTLGQTLKRLAQS